MIKFNLNPLEATAVLLYLGRTVMYNNSDWSDIYSNLSKAHRIWGMVEKVVGKTVEPTKAHEMMNKALVHAVILYGREIWVVTDEIMSLLEVFHHSIDRWITGMTVRKGDGGECEWDSVDTALETTGIWPIRDYIRRRKATISEYLVRIQIYIFFTGAEWMKGFSRFLMWWDQNDGPKHTESDVE